MLGLCLEAFLHNAIHPAIMKDTRFVPNSNVVDLDRFLIEEVSTDVKVDSIMLAYYNRERNTTEQK